MIRHVIDRLHLGVIRATALLLLLVLLDGRLAGRYLRIRLVLGTALILLVLILIGICLFLSYDLIANHFGTQDSVSLNKEGMKVGSLMGTIVNSMKVIQIELSLKTRQSLHFKVLGNALLDKEFWVVNHKGPSFVNKGGNVLSALVFHISQHLMKLLWKGTGPTSLFDLRLQLRQRLLLLLVIAVLLLRRRCRDGLGWGRGRCHLNPVGIVRVIIGNVVGVGIARHGRIVLAGLTGNMGTRIGRRIGTVRSSGGSRHGIGGKGYRSWEHAGG